MKLFIFLTLVGVSLSLESSGYSLPPQPVLSFKFEVNPKNYTQVIGDYIDSEKYATYNPNVTATQLIFNTNINELRLDQWLDIVAKSKLNFSNINTAKLKEISRTLHVNTSVEYIKFVEMVENPYILMGKALEAIHVDDLQVMMYNKKNPIGNESFFDAFDEANFTNLPAAQEILNLTDNQIFEFGKDFILKYLSNVTLYDFGRLVKNLTGEVNDFEVGFEKGQVGIMTSLLNILEVYPSGDFAVMIEKYNQTIVNPVMLATRVSTGKYLSSSAIYEIINHMTSIYTKPFLLEEGHKFEVTNTTYNGSLVNVLTNDTVSYTQPEGVVTHLQYCYYATKENRAILVSAVENKDQFLINKDTDVVFIPGAPLFCDGQLVGVALRGNQSKIIFAKVPCKMNLAPITPTQPSTPNTPPFLSPSTASELMATINFNIIQAKIPSLIGYLLMDSFNGNKSETNTDRVSPLDVIEAFDLESISYQDFIGLVKDIPLVNEYKDVLSVLKSYNASMTEIYKTLTRFLSDAQQEAMFKAVNISYSDLQRLVLYYPKNETKFKEFISQGVFNQTTVRAAMQAGNLNQDTLYEAIKYSLIQALINYPLQATLDIIEHYGGYPVLDWHIQTNNISPEAVKLYEGFQKIIKSFYVTLRKSTAQGAITGTTTVLTANDVYDMYSDPTTRQFVYLEINANLAVIDAKDIIPYSSGYANITLKSAFPLSQPLLPIGKAKTLPESTQCKVVTVEKVFDFPAVRHNKNGFEVDLDKQITTDDYRLGSALTCEGRIYGIATGMANSRIQFARIREDAKPTITEDGKPIGGFAVVHSYSSILLGAAIILVSLIRFE